jgi:hypothetical protein
VEASDPGEPAETGESETVPARALEGRAVCNGRYLLRRKTGHSRTTVRFVAHDLHAQIDVDLDLHPDGEQASGYRLGRARLDDTPPSLPELQSLELEAAPTIPATDGRDLLRDAWRAMRSIFRR